MRAIMALRSAEIGPSDQDFVWRLPVRGSKVGPLPVVDVVFRTARLADL
jgi:hypothetical protein